MPTSSDTPAEGGHPFDVERFARETIHAIEYDDDSRSVLEDHLIRIEECIAARWPRRWLLWARLRREIRASAASWEDAYIPRGDFRGRRSESTWHEADGRRNKRERHHEHPEERTTGWQRHTGWDSADAGQPGDQDPGAGYLP